MEKILIIQTAFIGDVILATPLVEALRASYPDAEIDFLLRKGNEGLLKEHPKLNKVIVWDKSKNKYKNLLRIIKDIRQKKYDAVYNLQRFSTTGFITMVSGAKVKVGFNKNPFSFCYTTSIAHEIGNGKHEIERNLELISQPAKKNSTPKLYPGLADIKKVSAYKDKPYVCLAPASVWFTKKLPTEKWVEIIKNKIEKNIYLLGSLKDKELCDLIIKESEHTKIKNLAGELELLETAALMKDAEMNYVNDSAPLHLASAVNAPVTAFFCSTIPEFGFGPLSDIKKVVQTDENLSCRPCGLHGKTNCPKGHYKCGYGININGI